MRKTAVVIPTLNAVKCGKWTQVLDAVAMQNMPLDRKIIIDSSSTDTTCEMAESYGWQCKKIDRSEFNHGTTRNAIVQDLAQEGFETIVLLSQDVVLTTSDALEKITSFLWSNPIAGCYGKQKTTENRSFNAWQRKKCYAGDSMIKTLNDVSRLGMMTIFFSNAFAAWKAADAVQYGGFPETDFGEDMLLAARILNQGGAVGYCAQAVAVHEHSNAWKSLFLRGMQVGAFHRRHPELLRQFGTNIVASPVPVPWTVWFPLGVKITGYICGRIGTGFGFGK